MTAPFELYPGEVQVLASRPWMSTEEWAEKHFRLVTGRYSGQFFRHSLMPYARGIMRAWDDPTVRRIFLCGTSQTGKTTIAYACLAAEQWRDPAPAAIAMPDEKALRRVMEEKMAMHFRRSPELRAMLSDSALAVQRDRLLLKGATLWGIHMGSEMSMSSVTLKLLLIDEEDACQVPGAAQVVEERVTSYADSSKVIRLSKPRGAEGESSIWTAMKAECPVIYQWRAVCPACQTPQIMKLENIRVPKDVRDPKEILHRKLAWYQCEKCGFRWDDYRRDLAVAAGHWWTQRKVVRPLSVGFHMPSWISRNVSLSRVMHDWFAAVQDGTPRKMEQFDNAYCARPYKVQAVETREDTIREMIRPELPPLTVPQEAVVLTAGIDSQMTGFWFVVRAFARTGESWLVQYGWLTSWNDVEELLFNTRFPVQGRDDVQMAIWRAGIDMGGTKNLADAQGWSKTEEVKMWLIDQQEQGRGDIVHGIKGASRAMQQIVRPSTLPRDPKLPSRYQEPLTFYLLDTEALKDAIHFVRLRPDSRMPMWLHSETDDSYLRQMMAEKRVENRKTGKVIWDAGSRANHLFDCEVYAAACAHPDWTPSMRTLGDPNYIFTRKPEQQPKTQRPLRIRQPGRINPWANR
ncbi:phage terminase large subunit family protein [Desulfobaculum bizertense]|uniref:terminase gpA endonuclease subunit n=1 Tax=Desulfobaculum bizertense TaxID=376490 RepID=UPI001F4170BB|nr:terminase gpA endonuclease subunit [Desulfobaculum bizertense]UIJ38541.1 phage terminase large subunit family protein [Desulfobaculum bizertense]